MKVTRTFSLVTFLSYLPILIAVLWQPSGSCPILILQWILSLCSSHQTLSLSSSKCYDSCLFLCTILCKILFTPNTKILILLIIVLSNFNFSVITQIIIKLKKYKLIAYKFLVNRTVWNKILFTCVGGGGVITDPYVRLFVSTDPCLGSDSPRYSGVTNPLLSTLKILHVFD